MTETFRLEEAFQKFIIALLSNEKYRVEGFQAVNRRSNLALTQIWCNSYSAPINLA
jgi:hypothetical protein